MPIQTVYLFGSHARGEAGPDSDVDLCIVSEGAERQFEAAARLRHVMWGICPRPAFTLIPISPRRLDEKRRAHDHFFSTVLREGIELAS
jgi:predicted nucleotidyltransferase